jgi:hypothetical protein
MTDSEKDGGEGLRTAAYAAIHEEENIVLKASPRYEGPEILASENDGVNFDELVRRSDVKALVQERINQAEEKVEKYNGLDKLNLNDAKARKQELKELLEDIEE